MIHFRTACVLTRPEMGKWTKPFKCGTKRYKSMSGTGTEAKKSIIILGKPAGGGGER